MNRVKKRCETLHELDLLSAILIERFSEKMTLGELRAALIAHRASYTHKPLTVTELARRSGQPKQAISRWLQRARCVTLTAKPDDARSKLIECNHPDNLLGYVDEIVAFADQRQAQASR